MNPTIERYLDRYDVNQRINWRSNMKPCHKKSIEAFTKRVDTYFSPYDISLKRHKYYTDSLKSKDFYNLPIGIISATDGIYDYQIRVSNNDVGILGSIYEGDYLVYKPHITISKREESYFEDGSTEKYQYNDPKLKELLYMVSVGGLTIHSHEHQSMVKNIMLKPRGSFLAYVLKEISS